MFLAGRVGLEIGDATLDESRLPGRQGRLLFAYLAAQRGRPVPYGELAAALWGESPPRTWEKALSVLVSKLRGLLAELGLDGPGVLTSAFGCYRLALPDGWIDVIAAADGAQEAEAALSRGECDSARQEAQAAERLMRGSFLPGEDGDWVEEKRRELAEVRGRALTVLADASLRLGAADEAMRWAEKLIAAEPFRETGHRLLMQAHGATGNRAEALRAYERCRTLLREELGAAPSPETEELFLGLRDEPAPRSPRTEGPAVSAPPPSITVPPRARRGGAVLGFGSLVLATVVAATLFWPGGGHAHPRPLRPIASAGCSVLHQGSGGTPQLLIAADLPLQPGVIQTTSRMVDAMTLELERRKDTAGSYRVALQVCDDAGPNANSYDDKCTANAKAFVADPSVIGVVGPFLSSCAMLELPLLDSAGGGPVPVVSPSTTHVGLTRPNRSASSSEPDVYYPSGSRNYVRVVPADDVQAAADAMLAKQLGVRRIFALDDAEPMGKQFVDVFVRASDVLGVSVVGRSSWDFQPGAAAPLADAIARTRPDAVLLGIDTAPEDVRLLHELRRRLGESVTFIAPDVFDPTTASLAGAASQGMHISLPGSPHGQLTAAGASSRPPSRGRSVLRPPATWTQPPKPSTCSSMRSRARTARVRR